MKELLLLGCGHDKNPRLRLEGDTNPFSIITLDMNKACEPDVVFQLGSRQLPFDEGRFDEVHAYEVLEHLGRQGDWRSFFKEFEDYWRVLKPGGLLIATVPHHTSMWAWGDPGHTRVITAGTLSFLDRTRYGKPPMTDYRAWYNADFEPVYIKEDTEHMTFAIKAHKPVRV